MPRTSNRLDRINDQVTQELAVLIREELRDPRLGMVSVLETRVSRDLAHADVYVTVLNADSVTSTEALNHAAGYLRTMLAKRLNLRATPKLRFIYDISVERGRNLSALIDKAVALDASQHVDDDPVAGDSEPVERTGDDDTTS